MANRFKTILIPESNEDILSKAPMIIAIFLIYISTMLSLGFTRLTKEEAAGTTIVMLLQLLVYLFADRAFKKKYWLYFIIQGIITFDYAVVVPHGYTTIFLGLIPVLIIQSMSVYNEAIKVVITSLFFYIIFCFTIILFDGVKELIHYIPIFVIITIGMRAYSILYLQQVKSRIQTQKLLQELELAYEKVEELTLLGERHRVARDLHDTLSQGLAGTILQLEAVNANLKKTKIKRAEEIVEKAMEHARKTLADSRLIIDDLRFESSKIPNLAKALEEEIEAFKVVYPIHVVKNIKIESKLSSRVAKNIIYIVREALNNISKHSKAESTTVHIEENGDQIHIIISDDGIGFEFKHLEHQFGHYGIIGMKERVEAINGEIKIRSKVKKGTSIDITIPIEKGRVMGDE